MLIVHATSPTAEKIAQAAGLLPTYPRRDSYKVKTACSTVKTKANQPSTAAQKEVKKNG